MFQTTNQYVLFRGRTWNSCNYSPSNHHNRSLPWQHGWSFVSSHMKNTAHNQLAYPSLKTCSFLFLPIQLVSVVIARTRDQNVLFASVFCKKRCFRGRLKYHIFTLEATSNLVGPVGEKPWENPRGSQGKDPTSTVWGSRRPIPSPGLAWCARSEKTIIARINALQLYHWCENDIGLHSTTQLYNYC